MFVLLEFWAYGPGPKMGTVGSAQLLLLLTGEERQGHGGAGVQSLGRPSRMVAAGHGDSS